MTDVADGMRFSVRHRELEFSSHGDTSILNAARAAGVAIPHTCGGQGRCRTCRFRPIAGSFSAPSAAELKHRGVSKGERLACQSFVLSDVELEFVGPIREGLPIRGDLCGRDEGAQIQVPARPNARRAADTALLVPLDEALGLSQPEMNERLARISSSDEREIAAGHLRPAPGFGSEEYSEEDYRAARRREKLLYFNIEFTNKCNLACTGCFAGFGDVQDVYDVEHQEPGYRHTKQVSGPLILEELQDIIDQAVSLGARTIDLIGGGEPLLSKMFFPLAEYSRSKGLEVEVFTNGTLITPSAARRMAELRVLPFVKMYSARSWVHDRMVGTDGAWEKALAGIENLLHAGYGRDDGLPIALETIAVRRNLPDIPVLWRWARENHMIPYFERFVGCHYDGDPGELLDARELKELWEELWLIDRGEYSITWPLLPIRVGYTCATNFYSLYINYEGEIRPCSGVFIPLGNVRSTSLRDILTQSPVVKDLREYSRPSQSWCAGCFYYERGRCPGCRGMAMAATDYMGDDPLCFHNPRNLLTENNPRRSPHLRKKELPDDVTNGYADRSGSGRLSLPVLSQQDLGSCSGRGNL